MKWFAGIDGNTPLAPEEAAELIPDLSTRNELNQWERQNILLAEDWLSRKRSLSAHELFSESFVRALHRKMFNETWKWAGRFRTSERNLGVPHHRIREDLSVLLGDTLHWMTNRTYPPDELALRFHHRLVQIHCFPNGNGRHARILADLLALTQGVPRFTWGSADKIAPLGEVRARYIAALQAADRHDYTALIEFSRS